MMLSSTIPLKSDVPPYGNTAGQRRKRCVWRLSLLSLCLLALASCSESSSQPTGGTGLDATHGGIAVAVQLADAPASVLPLALAVPSINCATQGIGVMSVEVLNSAGTSIAQGDFSCASGEGTLTGIPNGAGYQVRVTGRPVQGGAALYLGNTTGITVNPGLISTVGPVTIARLFSTLTLQLAKTTLAVGETTTATLTSDGPSTLAESINLTGVTFFSSFVGVAYSEAGGMVTAIGAGSNQITAKYAGVTSNAVNVTVTGASTAPYLLFPTSPAQAPLASGSAIGIIAGGTGGTLHLSALLRSAAVGTVVNLSRTCPSGITCTFSTPNVTLLSTNTPVDFTLQVTADASTAPGIYPIVVTGTGGGHTTTVTVGVTVFPAAGTLPSTTANDFSLSAAGGTLPVTAGQTTTLPVRVSVVSGTPGLVTLNLSGCPSGVSCSFNPNPVSPTIAGVISTLTVSAQTASGGGETHLTLTGTSGGLNRSIAMRLRQSLPTTRVSVASDGSQADGGGGGFSSSIASISGNGRHVAFSSQASNLVANDTNLAEDVFVHDRLTGQTARMSVASDGSQSTGEGGFFISGVAISYDGRYVSFTSNATNLVSGDTNGVPDIFVHDRDTDGDGIFDEPGAAATTRVSLSSSGLQGNSGSSGGSMSSDGRYIAFSSMDSLVPGDTNAFQDLFVRDTCAGAPAGCTPTTTRVSVASDGSQVTAVGTYYGGSISPNGRYVAFPSEAPGLVLGDTNMMLDYFVRDTCVAAPAGCTPTTTRVSVASDGSQATGGSGGAPTFGVSVSISDDGRYVAFASDTTNLVSGDTNNSADAFVRDTCTGAPAGCTPTTTRVSVASDGSQTIGGGPVFFNTGGATISGDGRYVAFLSDATNLVPGDTNNIADVFLHDRQTGQTTRLSVTSTGGEASTAGAGFGSGGAQINRNGDVVVFTSSVTNLVPNDTNGVADIFVSRP